jgi:MoxR-like ATPase
VQALAGTVLGHRLVLAPDALDLTGEQIVAEALAATRAF